MIIKKLGINIIVILCSILVVLLLSEGIIRLFKRGTGVHYPATWSSPALFCESKEGYSLLEEKKTRHYSLHGEYIVDYTINTQGFRSGCEYTKMKPPETKRIFLIGDSLVFGIGVNDDQTLAQALEKKLNQQEADQNKYEVLNLGVTGYTFDNSYLRLKKYLDFEPDLIIFVVLGVNDFLDIIDHTWVTDKEGDIVEVEENFRHVNEYSRLVNGPKDIYQEDQVIIESIKEFLRKNSVGYAFLGTLRHRNKQRSLELQARRKDLEAELEGLRRSEEVLDRFFSLAAETRAKTLFILEGFHNQIVKNEFLECLSKKTGMIIDLSDFNKVNELRIPADGHWSASGNEYIADIILEYITDRQLL